MDLNQRNSHRPRRAIVGVILALAALIVTSVTAAEAPVGLGTAESFAVLAGSGVTNTGNTTISGDLGTCPTPAVTGFPPGEVINGTIHAGDALCLQAQSDLTIAYVDAAGRAPTGTYPGVEDLGGDTLTAGVYAATGFAITGTLTLDAQGDPNAVWIFQVGSTLITAPNSRVVLVNGAQPCNVFWQVGSSATLGVGSTFVGTILALTSISANTNATVEGRLLARNGAVTLDSNTVTRPGCAASPTTTSSTTTPGATTTSSTTTPAPTTTSSTTTPGPTTTSSTTTPGPTTTTSSTTTPGPTTTTSSTTTPGPTTTTSSTTTTPGPTTTSSTTSSTTSTSIVVLPTTTSTSTAPDTTTTSTSTTVGTTTTTSTLPGTTTGGNTGTTTSTSSSTTTTLQGSSGTGSPAAPTTGASSTTSVPSGGTAAGGGGTATTTIAGGGGGAAAVGAGGTGSLARTGSSVRWGQFWGGTLLALGGVMVLLARQETPVGRRPGSGS